MKRITILTALILLPVVLVLVALRRSSSAAPRFVPGDTASFGSLTMVYRDPPAHFAGGMVWGRGIRRGGSVEHPVLYDIGKRRITGELLNAEPDFLNHDQTKLLCRQTGVSLKSRLAGIANRISGGRLDNLQAQYYNREILWVVNLRDGSATRIGEYPQWWKYESEFAPAPGFRYGFTESDDRSELLVCDLEKDRLTRFTITGVPFDWWDDHNILVQNPTGGLDLLDVVTGATNMLLGSSAIAQSLREWGITNEAANVTFFSNWNGRDYDLFLTGGPRDWNRDTTPFLVKIDHAGPALRLLYRNLATRYSRVLDATATHCLYVRLKGGTNATGGIILRDLRDGTEAVLDESDPGSYFAPRFYGDGVLFYSGDTLWRADLNGSNHMRLLPPMP